MRFTMRSAGPPAGTYAAKFIKIEPFEENVELYGPAVRLAFEIASGDHAGEEASAVCSSKLSLKSNLGKYALALNGGPIEAGTEIDFDAFVGATGMIVVEETGNGGSKVTTFLKNA